MIDAIRKSDDVSQSLAWFHFVGLLPIEDELKRDFYAAMRLILRFPKPIDNNMVLW